MDMDPTTKIKMLVAALLKSDTSQRRAPPPQPAPNPGLPTPQMGGLTGKGQQALQNRGNQLNRAIDEAS